MVIIIPLNSIFSRPSLVSQPNVPFPPFQNIWHVRLVKTVQHSLKILKLFTSNLPTYMHMHLYVQVSVLRCGCQTIHTYMHTYTHTHTHTQSGLLLDSVIIFRLVWNSKNLSIIRISSYNCNYYCKCILMWLQRIPKLYTVTIILLIIQPYISYALYVSFIINRFPCVA